MHLAALAPFLSLLPILSLASPAATTPRPLLASRQAPSTCNGHAELCERSYGNVTFIGAHNSYGNGNSVMHNQGKDVVEQLNDGIRTLQVQAHQGGDGEIHTCHTSCTLLDTGKLSDYLTKVKGWLDANPDEVITIVLVNANSLPPTDFASSFDKAGLTSSAYTPSSATTSFDQWPTLGSMISSGGRVVVFMNYQADFNSVPWIIDEFSNMWEDAFNVLDQSFECNVNRTSGSPTTTLSMSNHFLNTYTSFFGVSAWLPDKDKLTETNAETGYGSVGQQVENCQGLWSRPPNHILLDFYDSNQAAPFRVAARINGVPLPEMNSVTVSDISKGSNAQASQVASSVAPAQATSGQTSEPLNSASGLTVALGGVVASLVGTIGLLLAV